MALSDQLRKLAEPAREAEKHAAAARDMAKAELEEDRKRSCEDAQQDAAQLRQAAEAARGKISDSWNDVQNSWNEHNAQLQASIDTKIAEAESPGPSGTPITPKPTRSMDRLRVFGDRRSRLRGDQRAGRQEARRRAGGGGCGERLKRATLASCRSGQRTGPAAAGAWTSRPTLRIASQEPGRWVEAFQERAHRAPANPGASGHFRGWF